MTYRADVDFLDLCNPMLIKRNAHEFRRLHRLLDSADEAFLKATRTQWVSEAKDRYVKRLGEAETLATHLSEAYRTTWKALEGYGEAVETAKGHYSDGLSSEGKLSEVMARVAEPVTEKAQKAEPMRQWEDLRKRTGVLDWMAEVTADVDEIREEAEGYYNATEGSYADAARVEREARESCVLRLMRAYEGLPDFRGDLPHPREFLDRIPDFKREVGEAEDDPNVALPGSGPKVDGILAQAGDKRVSPKLAEIRAQIDGLPSAMENNYWLPSFSDDARREWIQANRDHIRYAAEYSELPPDVIAGIAWQEVGGDPGVADDVAQQYRQHQHEVWPEFQAVAEKMGMGGEEDETSMGPIAVQLRRSAEVLGYDPENMSRDQWNEVEKATQDPTTNIYIASEYLAQCKAESSFADVPSHEMTDEQYQELAARYNGGPYWEGDDAQGYGRGFMLKIDEARQALRD
ncbi:hypothetical protein ACWGJ2_19730 [Streptomyces sp. NPDC054796]